MHGHKPSVTDASKPNNYIKMIGYKRQNGGATNKTLRLFIVVYINITCNIYECKVDKDMQGHT